MTTKAMSESSDRNTLPGLPVDLRGKRAFIAGIADDNGYGWAIAKSLAAAGAEILVGTWVPALNIFETSLRRGKFDESRVLPDGSLMEITKVYPLDAVYDTPEDVPEDVKSNKRYAGSSKWTVKEVAESVKEDFGTIDILVHSLANGPEVTKHLLSTSRYGYLAAISASSYSFVSLLKHFLPIMNPGGATISLSYMASERIIPVYGGGMSAAKAALECDTRVLAFEAGREHQIRVNSISAGPLRSRAAKAIGDRIIDMMINYSLENAPLPKELFAEEVGNAAAFLASPLASAITGTVLYVDNGLNAMGMAIDSPTLNENPTRQQKLLQTSKVGSFLLVFLPHSRIGELGSFNSQGEEGNKKGGASICLSFIASERAVPGYGGGMSSVKAALECDTRVLAFEAGRELGIRVNTISAGPLSSRAARAIGNVDMMINYSLENAPLQKELFAEVGNAAAFLSSPLASAITGTILYVDNGLNLMGVAVDSPTAKRLNSPRYNKS